GAGSPVSAWPRRWTASTRAFTWRSAASTPRWAAASASACPCPRRPPSRTPLPRRNPGRSTPMRDAEANATNAAAGKLLDEWIVAHMDAQLDPAAFAQLNDTLASDAGAVDRLLAITAQHA